MCECWTIPDEVLWKDAPEERNADFILALVDWEKNTDPAFFRSRFMRPIIVEGTPDGVAERWVVYRSRAFSGKELTLATGGAGTGTGRRRLRLHRRPAPAHVRLMDY